MSCRSGRGACCGGVAAGVLLSLVLVLCSSCDRRSQPLRIEVSFPKADAGAEPIDGRLLVMLSTDPSRDPRFQINNNVAITQQIFGIDVDGLTPGGRVILDAGALGYPLESLLEVPPGEYTIQALLNRYETFHRKDGHVVKLSMDQWEGQHWNIKPGNLFSEARKVRIDPREGGAVAISLDKEIPPLPYPTDTKYIKYLRIESKLLSEFWGRPIGLGAFVLVPDGFDEHPNARYPLVVSQGHFQTYFEGSSGQTPTKFSETPPDPKLTGDAKLVAEQSHQFYKDWTSGRLPRMLTMTIQHANQYYDDSYSVNSANMGPYGDAITQELIPAVERKFRGIGQPWARALTGCSTGGWEALGAQVFYPDFFNGTWANSPSPIDLRAYRLVNIYDDENAYWYTSTWARQRLPRPSIGFRAPREVLPINRMEDGHLSTTMEQDNRLELVIGTKGRGTGLWDAMQAVFSPVGPDGYPKPIWDKRTGAIDKSVAEYWRENYDLGHILRRDWKTLGPKLVGKIHLKAGTHDQFYLSAAVRYVEAFLESTKDPYYAGSVEYGDRFVHCYTGDRDTPLSIARMTSNQREMPQIAARMLKTAPRGADVTSWRY